MSAIAKIETARKRTKAVEKKIEQYRKLVSAAYLEAWAEVVERLVRQQVIDEEKKAHLMGADLAYSFKNARFQQRLTQLAKERIR